jgi:Mg2+-importing ATPase
MTDEALTYRLGQTAIFAEIEPDQKERIVRVLQKSGHTVGFIGDGINDVSAIRTADVGISVDTAADVAKETADIVLLEKGLDVLYDGIMEGRKTFVNSLKYIFTTSSANFGNMFSVAGASLFLVFLPLLPKQILLINFLTDLPAMALASDLVQPENLKSPRKWNNRLIRDYMIVFGLQSTLFDFITFYTLYYIYDASPEVFRTGWFLECIITELFILMVLRSRKPFYSDMPGNYLLFASLFVAAMALVAIYSPLNSWLGFVALKPVILISIVTIIGLYVLAAEFTKKLFLKKHS